MQIIGFSGHAGSGKTTAARHLRDKHGFTLISFAWALKLEILQWALQNNINVQTQGLVGNQGEKLKTVDIPGAQFPRFLQPKSPETTYAITHRELMELWGNGRRAQESTYWIDKLFTTPLPDDVKLVIDDVRFPDEANMIRICGGAVIRINHDAWYNTKSLAETALDEYQNFTTTITRDAKTTTQDTQTILDDIVDWYL